MKNIPLKSCPFCGAPGEIKFYRYQGTGASGMETPEPYAACSKDCIQMKPVRCDDWPWGQENGYLSSAEAYEVATKNWNTRWQES